jgi:hypothetical protein
MGSVFVIIFWARTSFLGDGTRRRLDTEAAACKMSRLGGCLAFAIGVEGA